MYRTEYRRGGSGRYGEGLAMMAADPGSRMYSLIKSRCIGRSKSDMAACAVASRSKMGLAQGREMLSSSGQTRNLSYGRVAAATSCPPDRLDHLTGKVFEQVRDVLKH